MVDLQTKITEAIAVDETKELDPVIKLAIKGMKDADISILLQNAYKKLDEFEKRITLLEQTK